MTDLPERTRFEPAEVEPRIIEAWLASGLFSPAPEGDASENYSIAIPPPNVTGALHMGHALNGSIQDALIRWHRMLGMRTKWILGTDHAGIATQTQVERKLLEEGTSREEIGRQAFIRQVWEWRAQDGGTSPQQDKRRGGPRAVQAPGRVLRLRARALHAGRGLRRRGAEGVRRAVREGLRLPRQLHG